MTLEASTAPNPSQMTAPVHMVPSRMAAGPAGVEDFFWPISRNEQAAMCDALEQRLLTLLRGRLGKSDLNAETIRILLYEIIRDVSESSLILTVKQRCSDAGRPFDLPAHGRFAGMDEIGRPNRPVGSFANLRQGLSGPPSWLMPVRAARNLTLRDSFNRRRLRQIDSKRDQVSIATSPFMQRHAAAVHGETGRRVVVCSLWEWFALSPGEKDALAGAAPASLSLVEELVETALGSLSSDETRYGQEFRAYFTGWITEMACSVRFYLERLLSRPERLPAVLWYGGTNMIFPRILRSAVRLNGGRLVSHDHGRGIALCPNAGEHGPTFDLCDSFITYGPALAQAYEALRPEITQKLTVDPCPSFEWAPPPAPGALFPPSDGAMAKARRGDRRLMYVSMAYMVDRVSGMNFLPGMPPLVDWQCRLFAHLRDWGHEVLLKPHPEFDELPPPTFASDLGVRTIDGWMEDKKVYSQADSFVIDFLSSSFMTLIRTDKPILYVHFGFGKLSAQMRDILEKRCAIVDAGFDENNRAVVDWDALREGMEIAETRCHDQTAAKAIYGFEA